MDLDHLHLAIASGDANAFGRFMASVEGPLRRSLRPFATKVDIEAVVQEAFLRLWQVAPKFVPDGRDNGMLRLVQRIAKNLALDALKRRREEPIGEMDEPSVEVPDIDPMLRALIAECFGKLPQRPTMALRARLEDGGAEDDETLAKRCGMTTNTFLQNVVRARKAIAECLEQRGAR